MQYTVQYTIYTVGHARESCPAVPHCALKSIDPTHVPLGLAHPATMAIMIAPVADESPRLRRWIDSIIGHYNLGKTNHNQHRARIQHSNQVIVPLLAPRCSTRPTANTPIDAKCPWAHLLFHMLYFFSDWSPYAFAHNSLVMHADDDDVTKSNCELLKTSDMERVHYIGGSIFVMFDYLTYHIPSKYFGIKQTNICLLTHITADWFIDTWSLYCSSLSINCLSPGKCSYVTPLWLSKISLFVSQHFSGCGLVPPGEKLSNESLLFTISADIWHQNATMG